MTLGPGSASRTSATRKRLRAWIKVYRENHKQVVRVIIGNETILREEQTVEEMIGHPERCANRAGTDQYRRALAYLAETPELVRHADFIAAHLLPYWEGIPADEAVDYVLDRYQALKQAYPDKRIVISGRAGPATVVPGRVRVASRANQAVPALFSGR